MARSLSLQHNLDVAPPVRTAADWDKLIDSALSISHPEAIAGVRGELLTYERLFGITTVEMRDRVRCGALAESEVVLAWLMVDNRLRLLQGM